MPSPISFFSSSRDTSPCEQRRILGKAPNLFFVFLFPPPFSLGPSKCVNIYCALNSTLFRFPTARVASHPIHNRRRSRAPPWSPEAFPSGLFVASTLMMPFPLQPLCADLLFPAIPLSSGTPRMSQGNSIFAEKIRFPHFYSQDPPADYRSHPDYIVVRLFPRNLQLALVGAISSYSDFLRHISAMEPRLLD